MRIKTIKGHQGIGTEGKGATYVEAAGWGKYRWWRYLLGLVFILFTGLVVGGIVAPRIAFLLGGQEGCLARPGHLAGRGVLRHHRARRRVVPGRRTARRPRSRGSQPLLRLV